MGVQHTFGTAGATGGGWSRQPGTLQPAFEERCHEPRWSWQARGPKTWRDRNRWDALWSYGARIGFGAPIGSDGASPAGVGDLSCADPFEPFSCDGAGTQTLKFLKGSTVDVSDAALSGVVVQAFRTSDNAFAGYQVESRTDGSFDLATNFPGVNHYMVAYRAGSPDRTGATLNTLTPTNIDGT